MSLTKVSFSMINTTNLTVEDFGAVGDGVTNDAAALQAAFTYSATNNVAIFLQDKRYYTASTLQIGNAIIRSISGQPGSADPYYLIGPDGNPILGPTPNGDYYFNRNAQGIAFTFAQMIAGTAYGCCIVSDYNGNILECANGERINVQGFAVIGYHRQPLQNGIATAVPTVYEGANHSPIRDITVIGTGNRGIWLKRGAENTEFDTVQIRFCNGAGLVVGITSGVDSPVDNLSFKNSQFLFNRLNGLYFQEVRKHLLVDNCDFSGNGQYENGQQPSGSWVDPLLGYDRQPPTNVALMIAGMRIEDSSATGAGGFIQNVCLTNNTGELMAVGFHLRAVSSIAALQFLRVQNCAFFRSPQFPYSGGNNAAMIFLDVDFLNNSLIGENYPQACDYITFPSGIPPLSTATLNSNLFLDDNITTNAMAVDLAEFIEYRFPGAIGVQGTDAKMYSGVGTPEGAVIATIGSLYMRTNGGAGTSLYVKESGSGNTGWVAK